MAVTGLLLDDIFTSHDTRDGHPERPARIEAIKAGFNAADLPTRCVPLSPQPIDLERVYGIHTSEYIERVQAACASNAPFIDVPDSAICDRSFDIARLAAGSALHAVDKVMEGSIDHAFCAIRPPGHHAEKTVSMGFCLLNNIALAGHHLLEEHRLDRVLILDFDVHHGNGTQHSFESDPRVLFVSIHGDPRFVYPGTGRADERGKGDGEGSTCNVPVLPGASDDQYQSAFDEVILPLIDDYRPEFMLLSAGFDAHRRDPLAPVEVSTELYGWMTDRLTASAASHCQGRLVSLLEGGYDLQALQESATLHVERLLEA
ncbi:MAG: histone deacetylase [Phycisphaerae bacterium]